MGCMSTPPPALVARMSVAKTEAQLIGERHARMVYGTARVPQPAVATTLIPRLAPSQPAAAAKVLEEAVDPTWRLRVYCAAGAIVSLSAGLASCEAPETTADATEELDAMLQEQKHGLPLWGASLWRASWLITQRRGSEQEQL